MSFRIIEGGRSLKSRSTNLKRNTGVSNRSGVDGKVDIAFSELKGVEAITADVFFGNVKLMPFDWVRRYFWSDQNPELELTEVPTGSSTIFVRAAQYEEIHIEDVIRQDACYRVNLDEIPGHFLSPHDDWYLDYTRVLPHMVLDISAAEPRIL